MKNKPYLLYLEDDQIELMKFKRVFKKELPEFDLLSFENGKEGLDFLLENSHNVPKAIILDLNMPVMNGFEFLEAVKDKMSINNIPIIILTSSENENDVKYSYKFKVAGYFVKPFSTGKYNEIIQYIFQYWKNALTPNMI